MTDSITETDRGDVVRSEEEQAEIREEFPRLIDMTPSQMQAWSESEFAGENRKTGAERESARDALRRVMALKDKPMADWTEGDYDDAVKATAFVKRMSEVAQGDPTVIEGREGPSDRDASLRDWGHWTDSAIDQSAADTLNDGPVHVDAAEGPRVFRTCTMPIHFDAAARMVIDRAIEVAEQIEATGANAERIKAVADNLRTDGLADRVTTDGMLIIDGLAGRTGSQLYGDGSSTWYEFRSADEVERSLPTFDFKTFTDDHPPVLVTSDNWRQYARGMLGTGAQLLPPDDDRNRYVKVKIVVGDISTLRRMRGGKLELSTGYTTIAVRDPGVDAAGIRYTYRQTDIRVNHLALVDKGRAGPRARVLADSAAFEINEDNGDDITMSDNKTDQLDPEQAKALLGHIAAYMMPPSEEASAAAIEGIAMLLGMDVGAVAEMLGHGESEMMSMDGVSLRVPKAAAVKIREREQRVTSDAASLGTKVAEQAGELASLSRMVDRLTADADSAKCRELEREIADACPKLVDAWRKDATKARTQTEMQIACILDLDPSAADDITAAKLRAEFDSFIGAMYSSTMRHTRDRRIAARETVVDAKPVTINTSGFYGRQAN